MKKNQLFTSANQHNTCKSHFFTQHFSVYINNVAGRENPGESSEDEYSSQINALFEPEPPTGDSASQSSHHSGSSRTRTFSPVSARSLARSGNTPARSGTKRSLDEDRDTSFLARTTVSTGAFDIIYINRN